MRRACRRFLFFCLLLAWVLSLAVPAYGISGGAHVLEPGKKGSITVYKYDLTRARAETGWSPESIVTTGQENAAAGPLQDYGIQGVVFSYCKIADFETLTQQATSGQPVSPLPLYAFPAGESTERFLAALRRTTDDARFSENGKYYFASETLNGALAEALAADPLAVRDALEAMMRSEPGTPMGETDESGCARANNLDPGLYLLVETSVPGQVLSTTDPFLVSLPMTTLDGLRWNYDVVVYPKNNTGSCTVEQQVRRKPGPGEGEEKFAHTASAS